MSQMISTTILLVLIMDPLGNLPIVMSILKNLSTKRRNFVLLREMMIALIIMILFLLAGEKTLSILALKAETVSIAGGIILFLIAIKMIFPEEDDKKKKNDTIEPFLVPLAIPLIAGPSLLATLMLLSHQYVNQQFSLFISLFISWGITLTILMLSNLFLKILGPRGVIALERLMGLILIMLSTQMFLDGITKWCKS
ncbi:YhgN family NAAT transporter [Buchnera aphidicola]|uniref:YhgN family NAAT transporter n=1 Tax=Buchnera aphidicola TaxID=9 RepID=UPI0031B8AB37